MNKRVLGLLFAGLLVLTGNLWGNDLDPRVTPRTRGIRVAKWHFGSNYDYSNALVLRVVDGDTLVLDNHEKVRLIGIDTPEIHDSDKLNRDVERSGQDAASIKHLGKLSYDFTRKLVEGKRVRLEFDAERFDRYKRILAYVYLEDGTFVNAEIVKQGYASLLTFPPNVRYADLFLGLYKQARDDRRGLWGK